MQPCFVLKFKPELTVAVASLFCLKVEQLIIANKFLIDDRGIFLDSEDHVVLDYD